MSRQDDPVVVAVTKKADEPWATINVVPMAQRVNPAISLTLTLQMGQGRERFAEALLALTQTTLQMGFVNDVVVALEEMERRVSGG